MSFSEVLQQLPHLTLHERQMLIRRALELDEPGLSDTDQKLVESRLTALQESPASGISPEDLKARLRSRYPK